MDLGGLLGKLDDALGDRGDDVTQLIKLVSENSEALRHLNKLPDFLTNIADALDGAGEQAKVAAVHLVGKDGRSGMQELLGTASTALGGLLKTVESGAERIADAAELTGKVPLMDKPAGKLADAASDLLDATGQLTTLAEAMDSIGDVLGKVGQALTDLGSRLDDSGAEARGFAALG